MFSAASSDDGTRLDTSLYLRPPLQLCAHIERPGSSANAMGLNRHAEQPGVVEERVREIDQACLCRALQCHLDHPTDLKRNRRQLRLVLHRARDACAGRENNFMTTTLDLADRRRPLALPSPSVGGTSEPRCVALDATWICAASG